MGSTWAVDLKDVGAVYPLLGWEVIMVVVAIALWLIWHFVQIREENHEYAADAKAYGTKEGIKKAIDEFPS
jgi:hypothetical protein